MKRETVRIESRGRRLAAKLELPPHEPKAYALFAHCFTCSKDLRAAVRVSRGLVDHGIAVLRFDFTGLGESEGELAESTFSRNLDDLVAAADWLRDNRGAPDLLVGHSLGGAAVIAGAQRIPDARAVATIGAPSSTEHLRERLIARAPAIQTDGKAWVRLGGREFRVDRKFVDDLAGDRVEAAAQNLRRALMIFHSPVDESVSIDHAARLYRVAKHPKSFVALDGADHLLMNRPEDAAYVAAMLAAWASRYVDYAESAPPPEELEAGDVLVRGYERGFRNDVYTSRHHLLADEPTHVPGGTDTGPSPYDYVIAGLGACTTMTLRMYADRKKWPLEGVAVKLRHQKRHAKDCEDCETRDGKVDEIERQIELYGDLDEEQRQRLLQIADRCPVHRTLHSEIKVRSRLSG